MGEVLIMRNMLHREFFTDCFHCERNMYYGLKREPCKSCVEKNNINNKKEREEKNNDIK